MQTKYEKINKYQNNNTALAGMAQLVGALFCAPKRGRFISWSVHTHRL